MGYGHQKLGSSISAPSGQITTQKDGTGVSTVGLVWKIYPCPFPCRAGVEDLSMPLKKLTDYNQSTWMGG